MTQRQTFLWLPSPSPGRILRVLERMQRAKPTLPAHWLLSTPCPPQGLRLLHSDSVSDDADVIGTYLSRALQVDVTGLQVTPNETHWKRWEQGTEVAQGQIAAATPLSWWQKLPGMTPPLMPWQVWAESEKLPLLPLSHQTAVPYRTVASLDRRDLLVERTGTWYALTLGAAI